MIKNKKAPLLVGLTLLSLLFSMVSPSVETVTADHLAEPTAAEFNNDTGTIIVTFSDGVRTEFSADFFEEEFNYVPLGAYGGIIGSSPCASYIDSVNLTTNPATGTLYAYTDTDGQPNSVVCNEHQTFAVTASEGNLDDPTNPDGEEEAAITCESQSGALGWLACPIVNFLIDTAKFGANILESLLQVRPLIPDQADPVFKIWENVRDVGLLLLVIATLGLIFSEALSLNVSQLTVKRMLPRLVTAAIGVVLSFYLVAIAVDFFNVLGGSIKSLLESALADNGIQVGIGEAITTITGSLVVVFGAGAALISLGVIGFMTFVMLPVVLGVLVTLFTVVFRQVIIVALAVFAPVALAAWVLPNTEKYFKQWWDLLVKALFMYPLIMMLITSGTIFASILTNESTGTNVGFLNFLLALVAIVLPLFLVPTTFKAAGGVVGRIAGLAGDSSRGPIDRLRNAGKERTDERKVYRQEQARARMRLDRSHGDKSAFRTRMGAGALFRGGSSLRGQVARASLSSEALDAKDKLSLMDEQSEKKLGALEDFKLSKEHATASRQIASMPSTTDTEKAAKKQAERNLFNHYATIALDENESDARAGAAYRQLVKLRAEPQLRAIHETASASGSEAKVDFLNKLKDDNFGDLDSFASHISRGSFGVGRSEFAYSQVPSLPAGAMSKQKPETVAGTIRMATQKYNDAVARGDAAEQQKAISMMNSMVRGFIDTQPHERNYEVGKMLKDATDGINIKHAVAQPGNIANPVREDVVTINPSLSRSVDASMKSTLDTIV